MSGPTPFLFGMPSLARDGVPLQLHSRRCIALLAVTGTSHRREALAALFWPEVDAGRARAARSTHSRLRNTLEGEWLASDWETIGLDRDQQPVVDAVRFRSLPAQCGTYRHPADGACPHCLHLLAEARKNTVGHGELSRSPSRSVRNLAIGRG
jgi:DNA-binding SARP family transcriptional activator